MESQGNKLTLPTPQHAGEIPIDLLKKAENQRFTTYLRKIIKSGRPFKRVLLDSSKVKTDRNGNPIHFPAIDLDNPSRTNTFMVHSEDFLRPDVFRFLQYETGDNSTNQPSKAAKDDNDQPGSQDKIIYYDYFNSTVVGTFRQAVDKGQIKKKPTNPALARLAGL